MNETIKKSMDTFQLKGLRKILKSKTTFVDREQTNRKVFNDIQKEIETSTKEGKPIKQIKPHSIVYEERKTELIGRIIKESSDSPLRHITF